MGATTLVVGPKPADTRSRRQMGHDSIAEWAANACVSITDRHYMNSVLCVARPFLFASIAGLLALPVSVQAQLVTDPLVIEFMPSVNFAIHTKSNLSGLIQMLTLFIFG